MNNNNAVVYHATPLEQVHSLYLIQQVFGIPLPLQQGGVAIQISGRDAVQFLTTSGVDRGILRSIWSVADPQNYGSLTQIYQFWVVLRLVAMAQAGLLQQQSNNLQFALQQHAAQPLNLPFFQNVVPVQSNQLMQMYGHLVIMQQQQQPQQQQPQSNVSNNNNNMNSFSQQQPPATPSRQTMPQERQISTASSSLQSVGDAFGGLVEVQDAPLTPLQSMSVPKYNASPANNASPISDAFASMGETTNAPLPGLGKMPTTNTATTTSSMTPTSTRPAVTTMTPTSARPPTIPRKTTTPGSGGGGGFGFWSLGSESALDHANRIASTPKSNRPSIPVSSSPSMPMSSPSIPVSSSPSIPVSSPAIPASVSDDEDDFGDFGSAQPPPPMPTNPYGSNNNNTMNTMSSSPQKNLGQFFTPQQQRPFVTDFGRTNSAPSASNTVSVSDAFGDMGPAVDAPLPSLGDFGAANQEEQVTNDNNNDNAEDDDDDDDGFGNFEQAAADTSMTNNSLPGFVPDMPPTTQSGPSLSISDAFGGMQQDAPLPSLGDFANTATTATTSGFVDDPTNVHTHEEEDDDDDDDFGDFADAAPTTATTITDAFGDMPIQQDAPLPSLGDLANTAPAPTSAFADGPTTSGNDDGFGDFADAAPPATTITDAFGDMPIQQDAPLPSLGGISSAAAASAFADGPTTAEDNDDDDDDGFGDFADAPAPTATTITDAFGELSTQQDAPLPSLGDFANTAAPTTPTSAFTDAPTTSKDDDDDDFGDFADAAPAPPATNTIMDAFGELPTQPDAPLPSLGGISSTAASAFTDGPTTTAEDDDDDDFGDFEDAPATTATSNLSQPELVADNEAENDSDDDFGDFGGATMAVGQQQEQPPAVTEGGRSLSIDDAFGDMPVQADAPLPSLGDFATMGAAQGEPNAATTVSDNDDDDDFGDFENAGPITTEKSKASIEEPEQDDDFGDFEDAGPEIPAAASHVRSVSIDDAFGDFAAPADAPLPPLELLGSNATNPPSPSRQAGSGDDFGDFSGAAPQSEISGVNETEDEFGDFGTAENKTEEQQQSISVSDDPFADMPSNDAPLPSLEMLSTAIPTNETAEANATNIGDDSDDEFGGFETPAAPEPGVLSSIDNTTATAASDGNLMDFGAPTATNPPSSMADAPLPSLQNQSGVQENDVFGTSTGQSLISSNEVVPAEKSSNDGGDLLDMFGSEPPATTPNIATSQSEEDDFGDFGSAPAQPTVEEDDFGDFGSAVPANPADAVPQSTDEGDFGDFGSAPAQPNVQEDDFGDFGSAEPATNTEAQAGDFGSAPAQSNIKEDDFGNFGSVEPATPAEIPSGDDFGDFGSAPAQSNIKEDDFGNFGSVEPATPAEIPSGDDFGDFGSAPAQSNIQEDDFGYFGSATPAAPAQPINDDDFGDFGSAPVQPNAQEDDFGDFGSATPAATPAQPADNDDFGDFGSAPIQPNVQEDDFGDFGSANVSSSIEGTPHAAQSSKEDDFGDFGSAENAVATEAAINTSQSVDEDDFGDFGSANITESVEDTAQSVEEDDFGDFGSANVSSPAEVAQSFEEDDFGDFGSAEQKAPIEESADDFGAFSSNNAVNQPVENAQSGDGDFFSAFGSAETAREEPIESGGNQQFGAFGSTEQKPNEEDDFGDFGSAEFSSPAVEQTVGTPEGADEFGDFTVVEAPQTSEPENDDNFGDFSGFQESSPPEPSVQNDTAADDWGDFEAVSPPKEEEFAEEVRIQDRIRSLALQLPDCVLRKAGVSGDHVDLGESFEVNVGTKSLMTKTTRKRTERCIQVLENLTSTSNSKLASTLWVQIFDVVNEELEQAKGLLEKASKFSSSQWKDLQAPLLVMVKGLAEYMRVTRSIVASIGDVLLLDESAMLTVDTWASTWCSLSVLEKALECEKNWKEIEHTVSKTPLGAVHAASVEEIRSDAHKLRNKNNTTLCNLTLQPLQTKHKDTTKAEVSFQGKCFMACSANFLANRCPFFVVGGES